VVRRDHRHNSPKNGNWLYVKSFIIVISYFMDQTSTFHSVDTGFIYAVLKLSFFKQYKIYCFNLRCQGWPNFLTRGPNSRLPGHWRVGYSAIYVIDAKIGVKMYCRQCRINNSTNRYGPRQYRINNSSKCYGHRGPLC